MPLVISKNMMLNTLFLLLLSIFTTGFLWSFYLQKENNYDIERFYQSTNWYSNRILYHSEKFLYQAHLYQLDATPLSDLTQSYDLVWNRLQLFLESRTTQILRNKHPEITQDVQAIFNSIKALDDDFKHPSRLHSEQFTEKVAHIKNQLLKLNYSLSQLFSQRINTSAKRSNDLIQFWQLSVFIIMVLLATVLLRTSRRSSKLARLDPLTQLGNRRALTKFLSWKLKQKQSIYLCAIDLKRFKQINDQIGYQIGDQVLIAFAKKLNRINHCSAFRLGGDEFVLVTTSSNDDFMLNHWIQELKQMLEFTYQSDGHQLPLSIRLGVTQTHNTNDITADALLEQAIQALDEAKQNSEKGFIFYTEVMERIQHNQKKRQSIKYCIDNPQEACPLIVKLLPLYSPETQQEEAVEFQLFWKVDNSPCTLAWLADQHIYLQVLPELLSLACRNTTQPVLLRLNTPYQLEQLIQVSQQESYMQEVLFGLPSLINVSQPLFDLIENAQIPIAVEKIAEENTSLLTHDCPCYWAPRHLPSSPIQQHALFELAKAFNQKTLLSDNSIQDATFLGDTCSRTQAASKHA